MLLRTSNALSAVTVFSSEETGVSTEETSSVEEVVVLPPVQEASAKTSVKHITIDKTFFIFKNFLSFVINSVYENIYFLVWVLLAFLKKIF